MKQMVIPCTIATLLGGLVALGLFGNLPTSAQPAATVVTQAAQAILTPWPTAQPRVITVSQAVAVDLDATRLTLAYTRDGTVAYGYAIQLENLCVDPTLLGLYRQANNEGRDHLPALQPGALLSVVATTEMLVATRDRGTFLDPRSRKDWWRSKS